MPDLIIALLGLMVLGAATGVFVHRLSARHRHYVDMDQEGEPFSALPLILAFEPDSAVLWDTQLPALELIHSAGLRGIPLWRLHRVFIESAHHYPELYDGSSFHQWLTFLSQTQLIARHGSRVVLTTEGHEFLDYFTSWRSLLWCSGKRSVA